MISAVSKLTTTNRTFRSHSSTTLTAILDGDRDDWSRIAPA
jgi:hypothetical protein